MRVTLVHNRASGDDRNPHRHELVAEIEALGDVHVRVDPGAVSFLLPPAMHHPS